MEEILRKLLTANGIVPDEEEDTMARVTPFEPELKTTEDFLNVIALQLQRLSDRFEMFHHDWARVFTPTVELDHKAKEWVASYGDVEGRGASPALAVEEFEDAWYREVPPRRLSKTYAPHPSGM